MKETLQLALSALTCAGSHDECESLERCAVEALRAAIDVVPAGQARVPLTAEQISNRLWLTDWPEVMLSDFVREKLTALVRSVEEYHGIPEQGKQEPTP